MPVPTKRLEEQINDPYDKQDTIGFFILYIVFVAMIPYVLFHYASFEVFVTYFANVDIVANILAMNYPEYFIKWYNVYNDTLRGYLSYNVISVIALSGIFYFGLSESKRTKNERWAIMIIMSVITWTLPTLGIPYMNNKIEDYLINSKDITEDQYDTYRLFITIGLSLSFLMVEWMLVGYIERLKL